MASHVHDKTGCLHMCLVATVWLYMCVCLQFAAAMGANVTAIDTAADKEKECKSLGAKHFVAFNSDTPNQCKGQFDIILNT